jgi:hypothetical protein
MKHLTEENDNTGTATTYRYRYFVVQRKLHTVFEIIYGQKDTFWKDIASKYIPVPGTYLVSSITSSQIHTGILIRRKKLLNRFRIQIK